MKYVFRTLIVLLAIAGVAVMTCPKKDAHNDAIKGIVNEALRESGADEVFALAAAFPLATNYLENVMKDFFSMYVVYENNFVYSVEYFVGDGEKKMLSLGIFGHVFTISKDDLEELCS